MQPDAFLQDVHEKHPDALPTVIGDIAATWRSGTDDAVLISLAVEAHRRSEGTSILISRSRTHQT